MMRILIVDDHPLFRDGLRSAVRSFAPEADIYEATSIEGALDVIAAHDGFDVVLLDLSLPGTTGFSGVLRVRAAYPKIPVIIVSGHEEPELVREALSLGVAGYAPKSTPRKELARAIQEVLAGGVYVPKAYAGQGGRREAPTSEHGILQRLKQLTPQQLLVLEMIREGKQNKHIAQDLDLAETTIKAHVSEILRKLGVVTRTKAVVEVAKVDFKALRKP
jgi:DNA-binding NarL/FixJ family response regulator